MDIKTITDSFRSMAHLSGFDCECLMDGNPHSELAIIAEAPGEREVARGRPLIGGSGTYMWSVARKFGIRRDNAYITNGIKRQLAFSAGKKSASKHEIEQWGALLRWELFQLPNVKYVMILGDIPMQMLLGEKGITKWRGSVLKRTISAIVKQERVEREFTFIIANNPAAVLREAKLETMFHFDLAKLRQVLDGKFTFPNPTIHTYPTWSMIDEYFTQAEQDGATAGYDIETMAGSAMSCFGASCYDHDAICIPFHDLNGHVWEHSDELKIRRRISQFVRHPNVKKVAQNGMYDASFMWFREGIAPSPHWLDTMLAHHTLYPTLPHNLGFITTQYTNYPYYKDDRAGWKDVGDIDIFWRYNGTDCITTRLSAMRMLQELREQSLDKFFFEHVMQLQPELILMTVGGTKVDVPLKTQIASALREDLAKKYDDLQSAIQHAVGDPEYEVNPRSPKQLSELFFTKLRLVGRGTSTNKENRDRMRAHPATTEPKRKVLDLIDGYATDQKFLSTYAASRIDPDGYIRCEYKQTGVQSAPGRLSSAENGWHTGMNMQNQPERMYPMYITEDGYCFFYFDASQAEARLVACFANIETWIEQFERARLDGSYDAHRALAAEMFKVPYDDVPTFDRYDASKGYEAPEGVADLSPTMRFVAKRCRHGLNYRMMPDRLATVTGMSLAEATRAYNVYHTVTPELRKWWGDLEVEARRDKMLFNAFGRRLLFMERITDDTLKSMVAFKPQSTLGDKISQVIYQCHQDKEWPVDARISLNIHDALIGVAPVDKAMKCLQLCKKYAESPIPVNGYQLIIPIEAKVSQPDEGGVHRLSSLRTVEVEI